MMHICPACGGEMENFFLQNRNIPLNLVYNKPDIVGEMVKGDAERQLGKHSWNSLPEETRGKLLDKSVTNA